MIAQCLRFSVFSAEESRGERAYVTGRVTYDLFAQQETSGSLGPRDLEGMRIYLMSNDLLRALVIQCAYNQWEWPLTTRRMENHVNYFILQLLSNLAEVWIEIPVAPVVALYHQSIIYCWPHDSVLGS